MNIRHGLLLLLAGCASNSTPTTTPSPESSTPGDALASDAVTDDGGTAAEAGSDDAAGDAAPCNTIANDAPVVDVTQVAADPPTPQGGAIVDGTYWETALDVYTGPQGPAGTTGTSQTTALIQGETVQLVSSGQPARRTVILTTADAGFTSVDTCPDSQTSQGGYTATPTTLVIFLPGGTDDAGARTVVETLTKH